VPERTIEFGKFGARGIKGHDAVARRLDALAGFVTTPVAPGEVCSHGCTI
jgi:hypothetical protein